MMPQDQVYESFLKEYKAAFDTVLPQTSENGINANALNVEYMSLLHQIYSDPELNKELIHFFTVVTVRESNGLNNVVLGFKNSTQENEFFEKLSALKNKYLTNSESFNATLKIAGILACILAFLTAALAISAVMVACPFALPLAVACTLVFGASALATVTAFFSTISFKSEFSKYTKLNEIITSLEKLRPTEEVSQDSSEIKHNSDSKTNHDQQYSFFSNDELITKVYNAYLRNKANETNKTNVSFP
jgi:hypothetical protein